MQMGWAFPDAFAPALRMRNASPSWREKSLALASVQGNVGISVVARQVCRLSGPRGGAVRQGVSAATDADASSDDEDMVSWAAHRKAKKQKWGDDGDDGEGGRKRKTIK